MGTIIAIIIAFSTLTYAPATTQPTECDCQTTQTSSVVTNDLDGGV